jgi:hypothetical protein
LMCQIDDFLETKATLAVLEEQITDLRGEIALLETKVRQCYLPESRAFLEFRLARFRGDLATLEGRSRIAVDDLQQLIARNPGCPPLDRLDDDETEAMRLEYRGLHRRQEILRAMGLVGEQDEAALVALGAKIRARERAAT